MPVCLSLFNVPTLFLVATDLSQLAYESPAKEVLDMIEELKPCADASKLDVAGEPYNLIADY